MKKNIVIIGGGGHGGVVATIMSSSRQYRVKGFLDVSGEAPAGYACLGTDVARGIEKYQKDGCYFFVAIGENHMRGVLIQAILEDRGICVNAVHPLACIEKTATLGVNIMVGARAYVGNHTVLEDGVIINNGCIIEHDNRIGRFAHCAPGVITGGGVTLGKESFLGLGTVINDAMSVGESAIVGSGAVVVDHIPAHVTVVGVPAKIIKHHV